MDKKFEQTAYKIKYTNDQQAHEKMLIFLVIREMQINVKLIYHYMSTRIAIALRNQVWGRMWHNQNFHTLLAGL